MVVVDPPDALDNVESVAVRVAHAVEPSFVVEIHGVNDQDVSLPMPNRVSHPQRTETGVMRAAVCKNLMPDGIVLEKNDDFAGHLNDPIYHSCVPPGLPRIYLHPFPMQIVQVPGEVIILFEYDSIRHQIFTDGRPHDTSLGPLWMGDSIGHWEGDVLVVDTVNFNDKTWLDRMGHPHSDALHVVERIRRTDHDHLMDDLTIEDAKAFTKPWAAHMDFLLRPTWTLGEQFCEDEESFQSFDQKAATGGK